MSIDQLPITGVNGTDADPRGISPQEEGPISDSLELGSTTQQSPEIKLIDREQLERARSLSSGEINALLNIIDEEITRTGELATQTHETGVGVEVFQDALNNLIFTLIKASKALGNQLDDLGKLNSRSGNSEVIQRAKLRELQSLTETVRHAEELERTLTSELQEAEAALQDLQERYKVATAPDPNPSVARGNLNAREILAGHKAIADRLRQQMKEKEDEIANISSQLQQQQHIIWHAKQDVLRQAGFLEEATSKGNTHAEQQINKTYKAVVDAVGALHSDTARGVMSRVQDVAAGQAFGATVSEAIRPLLIDGIPDRREIS